jgi:BON domain
MRNRVSGQARPESGAEMSRIDDIRDAVIDDLALDPDVDASGITVGYTDGEVVLTGSVPSYPDFVNLARPGDPAPAWPTIQTRDVLSAVWIFWPPCGCRGAALRPYDR